MRRKEVFLLRTGDGSSRYVVCGSLKAAFYTETPKAINLTSFVKKKIYFSAESHTDPTQ